MAIDPSISLGYRPPQFQMPEIQTPLERFAKVLSLRNLMTQGEMGQLQLEQARVAAEQQRGLAALMQNYHTGQQTPTAPAEAPIQTPVAPPEGSYVPGQLGASPGLESLERTQPAPVAPPVPATAVTVGGLPGARLSGLPSDADILRVAPGEVGMNMIKNIRAARKADLEEQLSQLNLHKGQSGLMSDMATTMIDNETKNRVLAEAGQKGWIPWEQVRQFSARDFNDPVFQSQLKQWRTQTLGYDKAVDLRIKEAQEARAALEGNDKQQQREYDQAAQDVQTLDDVKQIPEFLNRQGPYARALLVRLGGIQDIQKFKDRVVLATAKQEVGKTVAEPESVQAAKVAVSAAQGREAAQQKLAAEKEENAALLERVLADKTGRAFAGLTEKKQNELEGDLARRGFQAWGAKLPTEAERKVFNFYTRAKDAADAIGDLEAKIRKKSPAGQLVFEYGPNWMQSEDNQIYRQAQREFTEARLRKESGAVISPSEFEKDRQTYFPQPGDTQGVLERKAKARESLLESMKTEAGNAYRQAQPEPKTSTAPPTRTSTGAAQAAPPGSWPVQVTKPGGKPESMWMGPDGKTYELPPEPTINTKKPVGRYNPKTGKIEAIP